MDDLCDGSTRALGLSRNPGSVFQALRAVGDLPDLSLELFLSWTETTAVPDWGVIESDHVVMTRHAWAVSPLRKSREWSTAEVGGYVVATCHRATRNPPPR